MIRLIEDSSSVIEAALSKALSSLVVEHRGTLHELRSSDAVVCATDFSRTYIPGARNYETSAVLLLTVPELQNWNAVYRRSFRDRDSFGKQSVTYKDTRAREDHLARLSAFVQSAGRIQGLLVTVSVPCQQTSAFTNVDDCQTHPNLEDFRKWDPVVFEKLVRTAAVLCVCLRLVSGENQRVAWLCDEDDIAADDSKRRSAEGFVNQWVASHLGLSLDIGLVLPSSEYLDDRAAAEDLLSIPDIAAGGIGDSLALFATRFGAEPIDAWIPAPEGQKTKANEVALWFADPDLQLVRAAISSEPEMKQAVAHQFGWVPK